MVEITPKTVKMQVLADFMQILTSRLGFYSKNLVFLLSMRPEMRADPHKLKIRKFKI